MMRSLRSILLGIGLGLVIAWPVRANPISVDELEIRHDHAARAATLAWWLGVQNYPHGELDTFSIDRIEAYDEIGERSVRAIARALDTTGGTRAYVAFNPFAFADPGVHLGPWIPGAVSRPSVVGPGDRLMGSELVIDPDDGARWRTLFAVDPPPIGMAVYRLRDLRAGEANPGLSGGEPAFATADSSVRFARRLVATSDGPLVLPVDEPAEGPWGRSLSFLQLGTAQGPGHPQVDVARLYKSPRDDRVVVRLVNQSGEPAEQIIVAPIAPIRAWQELGPDEAQIVAGDDVDLRGGALICDLDAGARRAFALELAPPPPYRAFTPADPQK